jgi:uncharacterized caspase-like protein
MRVWGAILALAVMLMPQDALAQTRRAFIAAVGDYKSLTDLQKTLGDASGYAQVFRDNLKFQVTQAPANATRAQFNAAFGQFLASIRPGDEVAFIFSGHGWSDGVENYLALSDAPRDASEYELKTETVSLTASVLAQINARNPRLTLAIVDACRDNPFVRVLSRSLGATRGASVERGLARINSEGGGLVVAFATAPGDVAADGTGANSPFTEALLKNLPSKGIEIEYALKRVRLDVMTATKEVQQPWTVTNLNSTVILAPVGTP